MPEWVEWAKIGAAVLMFIVSGLLTIVAFFARSALRENKERHDAHSKKLADVERNFLEFQAQLPRIYVLKDDHIRHVTILEKKIDELRIDVREALDTIMNDIKQLLRETPKRTGDG